MKYFQWCEFISYLPLRTSGGLVDSTPQVERQLQQELDKVANQYGGGEGVDMTKFPSFTFEG